MSILNKLKKSAKTQTGNDKNKQTATEVGPYKAAPSPQNKSALVRQIWITEKAGDLANLRQYSFIVDKKANKPEIKKAVEQIYKVKAVSVNIVNVKGKPRRMGRTMGRSAAYKKAIVTLKQGQKIDVMPT